MSSYHLCVLKAHPQRQKDALFSDAKLELEQLRQAIVQYQQKTHPESRALVRLDTEACSWSEVKEVIKIAPDSEVSGDEESWNAKGFCRKIAKNITAFENWLGLLPSGDYGAVVCGVFKMIVGVSKALFSPLPVDLTEIGGETSDGGSKHSSQGLGRYTRFGGAST